MVFSTSTGPFGIHHKASDLRIFLPGMIRRSVRLKQRAGALSWLAMEKRDSDYSRVPTGWQLYRGLLQLSI